MVATSPAADCTPPFALSHPCPSLSLADNQTEAGLAFILWVISCHNAPCRDGELWLYDTREILTRDRAQFDFRPAAMIRRLDLLRPIFSQTTNYGHFGKPYLPWEK